MGLDGGGTSTEALLCDGMGRVISYASGKASDFSGIPEAEANAHLKELLSEVLRPVGGLNAHLSGVYAGISGCGLPAVQARYQTFLERTLSGAEKIRAGSDAINALNTVVGIGAGIVAIAGTGSCVYYRESGRLFRVGGWGHLLGDEGSGYDLGRRAIAAALKALDGYGRETQLLPMLEEHAGCPLTEWILHIYGGDAKSLIASAAPLLLRAAEAGDETAMQETDAAAAGFAAVLECALERCSAHTVVLSGSVWKNGMYTDAVHSHILKEVTFVPLNAHPVVGALTEAGALAGIPAGKIFREAAERGLREYACSPDVDPSSECDCGVASGDFSRRRQPC